ncbi:transposable element Tcb2 transposase [Trichonephila clavipes]|nr:transposable element Tcb2 transposase [Trichonephila clavipes]
MACLVTSSSRVPLKTRRVGQRCTLNLSRAESSSRWRRYPRTENRVWSDQENHEERGSKDRAVRPCGPTVTRSTIRADVFVAIVPQTKSRHLAEANLKSKRPFRALPLTRNIGNCVYSGAKPDQCEMSQIVKRLCLVMNPGVFWGQMITVHMCGGSLGSGPFLNGLPGAIFHQDNARPHTARVAQDFLRHFQTLPWPSRSPYLSPVEHVGNQLKRRMPSCHSVHDLEFAVQDLWAHLLRIT